MDLSLNETDCSLQERARAFCDQILLPLELEVEQEGGLPEAHWAPIRDQVVAWGFAGINHSVENGGCGFSILQQVLINEQLGRATSGLWDVVFLPPVSLKFATDAQKQEYLVPSCRGDRRGCFAISEPGAGSDPRQVRTKAMKAGGDYILSGEKWFVTSFSAADYVIVHAHADDDPDRPTLFLVDKQSPGLHHQRSPHFMHTFIYDHAEIRLVEVRVPESKRLGEEGQGFELTKDWFVEARLQIGARCLGAATRALELATDYATEREQFGQPIIQFQGVSFPIADMAVEIMAAKSMLYRIAWQLDHTDDRKRAHAHASAVKLHCSEVAGRVVDRALQILGGRGYMRENPVERLYRDLRVDRIWEGTSEIQREVISGQIRKRGVALYTGW